MQSKFVKFLVVLAVVAIIANTIWNLVSAYMERAAARRAVAQADLADDPIGGSAGTGDDVIGEFSDSILIGEPWQWRMLSQRLVRVEEQRRFDFKFWPGDTDGNGTEELLVMVKDHPLTILWPDGHSRTTDFTADWLPFPFYCWDVNHDGRDELANGGYSQVLDLDGQPLLSLDEVPVTWRYNKYDIDSDGFAELIISGEKDDLPWQTSIYGQDGEIVWMAEPGRGFSNVVGDLDGDGRIESIRRRVGYSGPPNTKAVYQLELVNMDGNVSVIEDWPLETKVLACYDLDGDGADELINGGYGYLNMVTGGFTAFEIPDGITIPERLRGGETVVADLDGDGEPEIIHCCAPVGLLVFKLSGECVYFEKFFLTLDVEVLHSPEQDYVVVMKNDIIMIYP